MFLKLPNQFVLPSGRGSDFSLENPSVDDQELLSNPLTDL